MRASVAVAYVFQKQPRGLPLHRADSSKKVVAEEPVAAVEHVT